MTKLENFEVSTFATSTDTTEKNVVRMQRFWQDGNNAILYSIGRLLAPIASRMVAREEFALGETIKSKGVTLPLAAGQVLSLANVAQWGCPACGSAHGTSVGPSPKQTTEDKVRGLSANQFFYNPVTKRVFTISKTCYKQYVRDLKQTGRIHDVTAFVAVKPTEVKPTEVKPTEVKPTEVKPKGK